MSSNNTKDNLIESDMSNKDTRAYSISLQTHSFSWIHIISFLISLIFTCINFYNSLTNENSKELYLFLFFIKNVYLNWIFIIPCSLYVLLSIPYFLISKNREEISDRIKVKNYSLYCLLSSIFLLIYASSHKIFHILKIEKIDNNILKFIYGYNYLFFLLVSFWYRENLYYASSIIYEGNNLVKRIINCLKIIFCIRKIKQFASIDYNNDFLLHALASKHDFMSEDDVTKSFDQSVAYNI
jgi:heme/copper-type cytochrome/quinol oxidase subunit 4